MVLAHSTLRSVHLVEPVDAICLRVMTVEGRLMSDEEEDQQARRDANGESNEIDDALAAIPPEPPVCREEITSNHGFVDALFTDPAGESRAT